MWQAWLECDKSVPEREMRDSLRKAWVRCDWCEMEACFWCVREAWLERDGGNEAWWLRQEEVTNARWKREISLTKAWRTLLGIISKVWQTREWAVMYVLIKRLHSRDAEGVKHDRCREYVTEAWERMRRNSCVTKARKRRPWVLSSKVMRCN